MTQSQDDTKLGIRPHVARRANRTIFQNNFRFFSCVRSPINQAHPQTGGMAPPKKTLRADAPWRAKGTGVALIGGPALASVRRGPEFDYAMSIMRHPDPIGMGLAQEAGVEAAGEDCLVPGLKRPVIVMGVQVGAERWRWVEVGAIGVQVGADGCAGGCYGGLLLLMQEAGVEAAWEGCLVLGLKRLVIVMGLQVGGDGWGRVEMGGDGWRCVEMVVIPGVAAGNQQPSLSWKAIEPPSMTYLPPPSPFLTPSHPSSPLQVWPLEINSPLSWKAIEPMARELKTVSKLAEKAIDLMNAPLSLASSPLSLCLSCSSPSTPPPPLPPPLISLVPVQLAEKAIDLMNAPLVR
ncbi:unnamed protein product [Closterium sp. NIES-65]|nr:unnamed protein product [Closterium sp. NIES-65]